MNLFAILASFYICDTKKPDIIIITDIDTYAWLYRDNIDAYIVSRFLYFGIDAFSSVLAKPMLENMHDERLNH